MSIIYRFRVLCGFFCVAVFICVIVLPAPTNAQEQTRTIAINDLSVAQIGSLVRRLIKDGRYEEARQITRSWRVHDADFEARVRFTDGLIAAHSGNHRQAIVHFRAILAVNPNNDMARYAMTNSMAAINDVDGVRAQTAYLVQSGLDDRLNGAVTRLLDRTQDDSPLTFRAFASLLPSSNINSGTDKKTVNIGGVPFTINPESQRKSGIGYMLSGEVSYRQKLTPTWAFIASTRATGRFYPAIDLNRYSLSSNVGFAGRLGSARVSLAATAGAELTGQTVTSTSTGLRGEAQYQFNARWSAYISPSVTYTDHRTNNGRDGWTVGIYAHLDHHFERNHFIRAIAAFETAQLRIDRYSYNEVKLGAGYNREMPFGINAYVQGDIAWRGYQDLYPGLSENQKDVRLSAQIALTKRDLNIFGLAPRFEYRFERNISNAAFDDRTTHNFDIRLTADF